MMCLPPVAQEEKKGKDHCTTNLQTQNKKKEEEEEGNSDMKNELKEEEDKKEDKDYLSYKPRSCIFFRVGDAFTHLLEQRWWVAALRANASLNHSEEMMMAIISGNSEQNEKKMWRLLKYEPSRSI